MKPDAVKQPYEKMAFPLTDTQLETWKRNAIGIVESPAAVARAVKNISDTYNSEKGSPNVWDSKLNQVAYLSYFFPTNLIRLLSAWSYGNEIGFFDDLEHVYEFGSGPGTAHLSATLKKYQPETWSCLEASSQARHLHQNMAHNFDLSAPVFLTDAPAPKPKSLAIASYVMTETTIPSWFMDCDAIMIVEASTSANARRLMQYRESLIANGFCIWAPCTHQQGCPLLLHSTHDWCHMRIHWEMPMWFAKIEEHLPMKNSTLTYSYLLARKNRKPEFQGKAHPARVIGDTLHEKGKTRQAVCRKDAREFLSWLHRNGAAQPYAHGALIDVPENLELKGNELRFPKN